MLKLQNQDRLSLDNIWLCSNDSFIRVSCVRFVYRSFMSCIVRSFVCIFRIIRSFHFVRVSCVFRIVRVKRSFVFRGLTRFVQHISRTYLISVTDFEDLLVLQHITRTYQTFVAHYVDLLDFHSTLRVLTRILQHISRTYQFCSTLQGLIGLL